GYPDQAPRKEGQQKTKLVQGDRLQPLPASTLSGSRCSGDSRPPAESPAMPTVPPRDGEKMAKPRSALESPAFPVSRSLPDVRRRPSSAGDPFVPDQGGGTAPREGESRTLDRGEAPPNAQGAGRKRPETAPPGATTRNKRAQISQAARANRSGGHTGERGGSARVIEARLDALRADDDARAEFLQKVAGIIEKRKVQERRLAWSGDAPRPTPKTRKDVQRELKRARPLDAERKAGLVERLRSGGIEANSRATQTLLDPETKVVLTKRANAWKRAREERIRCLVSSCQRRRHDQDIAARESQAVKEQKSEARRERTKQARGRAAQTKGWLTVLKMHAAVTWVVNGLDGIEEDKRRAEAAKVITRHIMAVARHRFKLRLEAATKVIDNQFAKKIRRWKTKRDTEATAVLKRFLTDVKSSDVRTRVKLLAWRVAHAHVQLARLQRWWRRRQQEMAACRHVMCRLWEKEVSRRVDAKVDEIWRARNEASIFAHESTNSNNHQGDGAGFAGALLGGSALRWGVVRHDKRTSVSAPGGGGGGGGGGIELLREGGFGGAAKGKAFRQFKEEQARGEKATIRANLLLDPLINPPGDLRARMCGEYVKQMALRHAGAMAEFETKAKHIADLELKTTKFGEKGSLLAVSLAVQAGRRVLNSKGLEMAGMPVRPRWRTGPVPGEVGALVDAGVDYISGMQWLWEPRTPSRLEDGSLLADSMPTPEDLAARVASKFRYGGSKLAMLFDDEPTSSAGERRDLNPMANPGWHGSHRYNLGTPTGVVECANSWVGGEGGGRNKSSSRTSPMSTYHYLPPSSPYVVHRRQDGTRAELPET
ncbi:unnamed protein product, partial [Ectocarpus fasciculatus]